MRTRTFVTATSHTTLEFALLAVAVEYGRYRSRARAQLGATAFDAAVQVGRTLPVDSVITALK